MPEKPNAPKTAPEEELVLDIKSTKKAEEKKAKPYTVETIFTDANNWLISTTPINTQEILFFFQIFGSMINAGLSVTECFDIIVQETKNPRLKKILEDIQNQVESGAGIAESMRQHDDIFDESSCSVIEAGEKSGKLNEVLKELSSQYERLNKLQSKVDSITLYPKIVFTIMILLGAVVVIFVVPKLMVLFGDVSALPLPTRILVGISDIVREQYILLILGIITIIGGFKTWARSKAGRKQWGNFILSVPGISEIFREMILIRITRIFSFLVGSGVPIIESLKITAQVAENDVYKEKLLLVADDLGKGIMIAENISDDPKLFPPMLVSMMSVGEKTAALDVTMSKVANFYNDQLEERIKTVSQLIEPVILAVISACALFMILAIYLPILQMNDKLAA